MNIEDLPPIHSEEAERALLGAILSQPEAVMEKAIETLKVGDFFNPAYQELYRGLMEMHRVGTPIDLSTVMQYLDDTGMSNQTGGPALLGDLAAGVVSVMTSPAHIHTIKAKSVLRKLRADSYRTIIDTVERQHEPQNVIDAAQQRMTSIVSGGKNKLSIRSIREICLMPLTGDEDNHFGDRIVAQGQPISILGPGGVGKSRLWLQFAICMVTGRKFLDIPTFGRGKKWVFIQTENSTRRIQGDIAGLAFGLDLTPDEADLVSDNIFFHTIECSEDAFLDVNSPEDLRGMQELIKKVDPYFVVFDPLNTFTSGDLNSDKDMKTVCRALENMAKKGNPHRVPMIIHHSLTGKDGAAKAVGWEKGSYGRNSKVLNAAVRSQINISPRDPDDDTLLIISCGKNNNGKKFNDMGVKFDSVKGYYFLDPGFDGEAFREAVGISTKKPSATLISSVEVAGLFQGIIEKSELVRKICREFGASRASGYRAVDVAERGKFIAKKRDSSSGETVYVHPERN